MTIVAENNLPLIIVALLIGLAIAFWLFRGSRRTRGADLTGSDVAPAAPSEQGRGVPGEIAAATGDVAGEILGVDRHLNVPPASGPADDLRLMKGVGPKLAAQLNENGITRFDQLAGLSPTEIDLLDARMGAFSGRLAKDRVREQACFLARDDRDGFEAQFGKLGGGA